MFSFLKLATVLSLALVLVAPVSFSGNPDVVGGGFVNENTAEALREVPPEKMALITEYAGTQATNITGANTDPNAAVPFNTWGSFASDKNYFDFGVPSPLPSTDFSYYGWLLREELNKKGVDLKDLETAGEVDTAFNKLTDTEKAIMYNEVVPKVIAKHEKVFNAKLNTAIVKYQNPIEEAVPLASDEFGRTTAPGELTPEQISSNQVAQARQDAAQQAEREAVAAPDEIYCLDWSKEQKFSFTGCVAKVAYTFLGFCSWILWVAAIFFNYIIDYTLNIKGFISRVPIVDIGWTTFRDFANLFFVFIILYIAINTIIGNSSYGIKALLGKVIITAILINFSLFFTKVVIDTSNIFALQFYSKIIQDASGHGGGASIDSYDSGISAAIADSMGMSEIWGIGKAGESQTGDAVLSSDTPLGLNAANLIIVGFGGGLFVLVTALVFFAGGIMLLLRTITLLFLMILSPIAFVGGILPSTKGYVKEWWDKLFSNALFAPAYMAMLYLVLSVVLNGNLSKGSSSFVDMFTGRSGFIDTLSTFVVLNCLLVGCILVAKKIGVAGSGWAMGAAKGIYGAAGVAAGAGTFGLAAKAGRGFIGGGANMITRNWENPKNAFTRGIHTALRGVAGSSFDARNVGGLGKSLGLGGGDTKGFKQRAEERTKALMEESKNYGTEGKLAMAGSLQSRWRSNASVKAGDDILKTGMNEDVQKQQDAIQEWKDNPDYKRFMELVNKSGQANFRGSKDEREMHDLYQQKLSGAKFKLSSFDGTTGTWSKPTEGDLITLNANGDYESNVDEQARHRFEAQRYIRAKKHTAEERRK